MKSLLVLGVLLISTASYASQGLVINSAEFGVGKFHRYDNKVHPYDPSSAWVPFILPDNAPTDQPLIRKNADGSYSVFFSTLDDLISSVIKISKMTHEKVSVLNVHGHGLPGGMWFPANAAMLADWQCDDWRDAADGPDQDNYDQYYSAISLDEIDEIRQIAENPNIHEGCTTGLAEWQQEVAQAPAFKNVFADDAQIHFLSCVVGLGTAGKTFTTGIAQLLLPNGKGHVETSVDFGLGDWSMPEGMGFWDYESDAQLDHDNSIYVVDRKDREIMQKGTIRLASDSANGWNTTLLANHDFMRLGFQSIIRGTPIPESRPRTFFGPLPSEVRVPGTSAYAQVLH